MTNAALLFLSVALSRPDGAGTPPIGAAARAAVADDVAFYDRLHETFLALADVVVPVYLDHFQDEPDNLAIVRYYADRLADVHRGTPTSLAAPAPGATGGATPDDRTPPHVWMRAALVEARRDNAETLQQHLGLLGARPHAVIRRHDANGESAGTAFCQLFDPELLWAHRRLSELRTGRRASAEPMNLRDVLAARHAAVLAGRSRAENSVLSLRRFLDRERQTVQELAWLYRCLGTEQDRDGNAADARRSFLRAWSIDDSLFPAAERGRLERFDPVFLAELGDIYARLGRYDLMLRYMYSESGLPARFEMARPIAELARVAESVRLARPGEKPAEETFPETVTQILFEHAVPQSYGETLKSATVPPDRTAAYVFIIAGCVVIAVAVAAIARRAARRAVPARLQNEESASTR